MDLWASFSNSGVYLAVLAGGYLLKRAGLFRVQDARFLSAVIMNITLPAAIVKGFAGVELSGVLLLTFVFSFLVSLTLVCTGAVLSRGRPAVERGTTILNTNTFNCGNFAIPFLSGVVSSESFAAMCMFDVGAAIFTYGPNAAVAQRAMGGGKGRGAGLGSVLKKLFTTPTFLVYVAMVALSLLHWELPGFMMNVAVMAGNANSFLAMLCIGILFEVRFRRYTVCALAAVVLWLWLPVPREVARTLVVMLFAPVASCAPMITIENGCDGTVAAVINSISMVLSITIMTLLLAVLPV